MGFALSNLQVKSSAFEPHQTIPTRFTGDGDDIAPPLQWEAVPDGTQGFAVFCHDPDAPLVSPGSYGFVHWVYYNIPGHIRGLDEGDENWTSGISDFGRQAYGGPMPPEGHGPHHYYFWVLALDQALTLEPGLSLWQFLDQVEPHVIGMNRLIGTYKR